MSSVWQDMAGSVDLRIGTWPLVQVSVEEWGSVRALINDSLRQCLLLVTVTPTLQSNEGGDLRPATSIVALARAQLSIPDPSECSALAFLFSYYLFGLVCWRL